MAGSLLTEEGRAPEHRGHLATLPTTRPATDRSRAELEQVELRRRETIRRRDATYRRLLVASDLLAVALVLVAGALAFGDDSLTISGVAGALLLVVLVIKVLGLYDRDQHLLRKTTLDELPALFEVSTLIALLLWLGGDWIVDGDICSKVMKRRELQRLPAASTKAHCPLSRSQTMSATSRGTHREPFFRARSLRDSLSRNLPVPRRRLSSAERSMSTARSTSAARSRWGKT